MRTHIGTILVVGVALAVGGVAGWFAAGAWGDAAVSSKPPYRDSIEDNAGKAGTPRTTNGRVRSPSAQNGRARRSATADAKPRRKVDVRTEKRQEPVEEVAKSEEKPVPEEKIEAQKKTDNPFPRYLDMFKNDPEALAAEFLKEAEENRAKNVEMRKYTIDKLKLNTEQAAVFEKALDELQGAVRQQQQEAVDLIAGGLLNEDAAADGSIWSSNPLLMRRSIAARESAIQETAEKLYEQLTLDGVSDAMKQSYLLNAVNRTAYSYECLEPYLSVYDKVYKNMGVGDGIFSWCLRPHQKEKK